MGQGIDLAGPERDVDRTRLRRQRPIVGTPSKRPKQQIIAAVSGLPNQSAVVQAQDADAGGELQAGALLAAFNE